MAGKKILNIEIGEKLVKVCETLPKNQISQVLNSFMFQTPENTVNDGMITDCEVLAQKLQEELRIHSITNKNVVFSLVSGKVATRDVIIPPVKDSRIKSLVEINATEYFPVEMSQYTITYTLLERISKGADAGCRLLVMAVPNNILNGYFKLAEYAKLQVKSIDYSGNAEYRALKEMGHKEVTMFVNVDCSYCGVAVIRDGSLLMQRNFAVGGDQLIVTHMNSMKKADDEYLQALDELMVIGDKKPEISLSTEEIHESLSRLVGNVVRIVDYFNSSNWETPIEKIVLVGACGNLIGLKELIAESFDIPVENAEGITGFNIQQEAKEPITCYVSCIGSGIQPVDLIPEKYNKSKKKDKATDIDEVKRGTIICVVFVVASIAMVGYSAFGYLNAKNKKQELEKKIEELAYVEKVYITYSDYQTHVDGLNELKSIASSPNSELVSFIEELEKEMPSEITVLSAACTVIGVNMNVEVNTKEAAAKVISQLRSFKSLKDVKVSGISEMDNDLGINRVSFSVSCEYGENPYVAAEPKQ
ncbi:MAG TPA: hypothetical protein DIC60_02400 [Lachnospiraceae bacterium]|nr:hypothetical protein [Lachnospiraceae bacterium]